MNWRGLNYCQCDQPWRAHYRHLTSRPCYRIEDSVLDSEKAPAVDMVAHPPHYTNHPSGIECIQITEHLNFCIGNAIKYLWRVDDKGDALENLRKARWYVDREIARREAKS